jgi:hypothetical protein
LFVEHPLQNFLHAQVILNHKDLILDVLLYQINDLRFSHWPPLRDSSYSHPAHKVAGNFPLK